ncbi:hypothetical protein D5S17_07440 [Pseudonocardiaceae bacterium YIM PH 21723]|nr:hypothetical protein D5S17_07440 [Pseudonocardiaceae bacterium YIM PH 21723]
MSTHGNRPGGARRRAGHRVRAGVRRIRRALPQRAAPRGSFRRQPTGRARDPRPPCPGGPVPARQGPDRP